MTSGLIMSFTVRTKMIYPYQIEPYQKMCQTTSVTNEGIKNLARYLKLTKTNLSVSITIMRQNKMMYCLLKIVIYSTC